MQYAENPNSSHNINPPSLNLGHFSETLFNMPSIFFIAHKPVTIAIRKIPISHSPAFNILLYFNNKNARNVLIKTNKSKCQDCLFNFNLDLNKYPKIVA